MIRPDLRKQKEATVYVGLGSNLHQPHRQITLALQHLSKIKATQLKQVSSFYLTKPMAGIPQPDYVNAVAILTTHLLPLDLLNQCQSIEYLQGRRRYREQRWGPRPLDLDMLLWEDKVYTSKALTLPHPGLESRIFVLVPLHEVAPDLVLPNGKSVKILLEKHLSCLDTHFPKRLNVNAFLKQSGQ